MRRMKGSFFLIGLVVAAMLFISLPAAAQTAGRIEGKIVDSTGGALPGVTVTVSSSALQGARTAVTDAAGTYRFPTLPPGKYTVKAELTGFKTPEQNDVAVGIDRTVTVDLTMSVGNVTESVTVQAAAQVIDTTSTTTGFNANAEFFNRLPSRRDFYAVAQFAPGVSTDDAGGTNRGITIGGSTGAENAYIIDGLNTTGVELGTRSRTLNQDFIDEVEVKTGGLPAEYGRFTGGVMNVVTKSGGNTFHGSLFGFSEGGALQADDSTAAKRPTTTTTVQNTTRLWDVGASLGGYLMRDRLWFFGSYNPTQQKLATQIIRALSAAGAPALGSSVPATIKVQQYAGKVTWKLANNHTLVGSVFGDPRTREGQIFGVNGPPITWQGKQEGGTGSGSDTVLRYDGVFTSTSFLRAQFGRHLESNKILGDGRNTPTVLNQRVNPNTRTGGFGGWQDTRYTRNDYKADFTKFFANNEVKVGGDYEDTASDVDRWSAGAGQIIYLLVSPSGVNYVRHRGYLDDTVSGFDRSNPATWRVAQPLTVKPGIRNASFYGQDNVKLGRLSMNLGVRWERQEMIDRKGKQALALKANWAPRLGAIYDPTGDGKTKIYANYGRFYEAIPMDMGIRSFGGEQTLFAYNFDPSPSALTPDPAAPSRSSILGSGQPEQVDPNLRGQYLNEMLFGFEREVAPNFSLGVKFAYRNLGNVIEDFLVPSEGVYFIANPGSGIGKEMGFYDYIHSAPAPKATRKYTSVEVTGRKRYSNGWQLGVSYVWSKLDGNYDGTYQVSTGQLDPNINSAFDYADFLVNADGYLSNDRRNYVKVDGTYEVQNGALKGLQLGGFFHIASGYPLTAYGYSFGYANWEYYLTPRGSVGRGPADYEGDVHVAYPINLGTGRRIEAIMDVFNVLNRQAITQYDQRYNLVSDGACAGIPEAICNGDGGIATTGNNLTPAGTLSNVRQTATNPNFLKAGTNFTQQRSIRLGVRFMF